MAIDRIKDPLYRDSLPRRPGWRHPSRRMSSRSAATGATTGSLSSDRLRIEGGICSRSWPLRSGVSHPLDRNCDFQDNSSPHENADGCDNDDFLDGRCGDGGEDRCLRTGDGRLSRGAGRACAGCADRGHPPGDGGRDGRPHGRPHGAEHVGASAGRRGGRNAVADEAALPSEGRTRLAASHLSARRRLGDRQPRELFGVLRRGRGAGLRRPRARLPACAGASVPGRAQRRLRGLPRGRVRSGAPWRGSGARVDRRRLLGRQPCARGGARPARRRT